MEKLATQGAAYKYTYDLLIKTVTLVLPAPIKIFVVFKRGTALDLASQSYRTEAS